MCLWDITNLVETHCDFKNGLKLPHFADNYTEATIAVIGRLLGGRGVGCRVICGFNLGLPL